MASANPTCHFANLLTDQYPRRYGFCDGEFMAIEECQDMDENGYSESYLILLRSGHLNEYDQSKGWQICRFHKDAFGLQFENTLRQKKCFYFEHTSGKAPFKENISLERSVQLLEDRGLIVPYGAKYCMACTRKISDLLKTPVPEDEEKMESTPSDCGPRLDLGNSDTPGSSIGTQKNPRDMAIELIQTVEPTFDNKKAMWKTKQPIHQLKKTAKFKMRKTLGLTIKAAISAFTSCEDDIGEIWTDVKDSGFVEKALGQKVLMDSYIKEIVRAHNLACNPRERIQILSLVSKLGFDKLRKFNPPKNNEEMDEDETDDDEIDDDNGNVDDMEVSHAGDVKLKGESKKIYWNPPLTWDYYKNARIHYGKFGAGGRPIEKKVYARERIKKEVLRTIIDFVTSDEQQQSVAFGTILVKGPEGEKVRIARAIRKRHDAELIRQVIALLKENGMDAPAESTLRALFKLIPAGHAKDIKGLDPVYENHRRAFRRLQEVCTELHDIFLSATGDERIIDEFDCENIELVDKVQQALKICESYILGYFIYNVSYDSKCLNHCVTLACSDPKDKNFQEQCSAESLDESEDHGERCDYCNLFPIVTKILDELIKNAPLEEEGLQKQILEYDMDKAKTNINLYKKQVFRHYVGSQTWDKYFLELTNMAMGTMDWGMKVPPETHREDSLMWFGKVRNLILSCPKMILCDSMFFNNFRRECLMEPLVMKNPKKIMENKMMVIQLS